jgi:hypothetical protein
MACHRALKLLGTWHVCPNAGEISIALLKGLIEARASKPKPDVTVLTGKFVVASIERGSKQRHGANTHRGAAKYHASVKANLKQHRELSMGP